jgi:FtsH-binding integral membrane protein
VKNAAPRPGHVLVLGLKFARQGFAPISKLAPAISSRSPLMWILLLLPFVGLLWVPFYNFQEPALFGFPFFYWYQLAWVPISSVLIWLVYRSRKPDETS